MKEQKNIYAFLLTAFILVAPIVYVDAQTIVNNNDTGTGPMNDTTFIRKNIKDNMMEIELSQLAIKKATSQDVKSLAQQMISDHTAILTELRGIIPFVAGQSNGKGKDQNRQMKEEGKRRGKMKSEISENMTHNSQHTDTAKYNRDTLKNRGHQDEKRDTSKHKGLKHMEVLKNAKGVEFDTMWVSQMLAMHEDKLNELQSASSTVINPKLKMAINNAIPKIQNHRDRLKSINGNHSNTINSDARR